MLPELGLHTRTLTVFAALTQADHERFTLPKLAVGLALATPVLAAPVTVTLCSWQVWAAIAVYVRVALADSGQFAADILPAACKSPATPPEQPCLPMAMQPPTPSHPPFPVSWSVAATYVGSYSICVGWKLPRVAPVSVYGNAPGATTATVTVEFDRSSSMG